MRNVKIAAIQMQCSTNLQTNLEKAEKMVRQAAGDGAQIILLPELFADGHAAGKGTQRRIADQLL